MSKSYSDFKYQIFSTLTEADEHGARELHLYADNHADLHRQRMTPIHKNLRNKMAAGKYDHEKAKKLFKYAADDAAKRYKADHGHHFDVKTRKAVASKMADQFHDEAKSGDHDHHLHKKYKGHKVGESVEQVDEMMPHGMNLSVGSLKDNPSMIAYREKVKKDHEARMKRLEKEREAKKKNEEVELDEMPVNPKINVVTGDKAKEMMDRVKMLRRTALKKQLKTNKAERVAKAKAKQTQTDETFDSRKSAEEIRLRTKYRMAKDADSRTKDKPYAPEDMMKAMDSLQRKKRRTEKVESVDLEEKNVPNDPKKWAASKAAARAKFDVYPSAYANAWASKDYKKKGGTWRKSNEEVTESDNPVDRIQGNPYGALTKPIGSSPPLGRGDMVKKKKDDGPGEYVKSVLARQKKMKKNEEVEQVDELDAKTLIRYNNAASQQVTRDTKTDTGRVTPKTVKRLKGALKARKKLDKIMPGLRAEEAEEVDEKMHEKKKGKKHDCATHVEHAEWGLGTPVKTMHAEPDENGNIDWYDVMFEHGVEKGVPTNEMTILMSEAHNH